MRFLYPYLLLIIPFIIAGIFFKEKYGKKVYVKFSSTAYFNNFKSSRVKLLIIPQILIITGICLAVFALARPQSSSRYENFFAEGIDIMLVIDTSTSMNAIDPTVNLSRIESAKKRAKEFIMKRSNDRIAIAVFSSIAFTQCPLTLDKDALLNFVDMINTEITKADGTAIGSAIATAVNRLSKIRAKSKVIILLTDGNNNTGEIDPLAAAQLARENNVKIYTVGIGSSSDFYEVQDMFFGTRKIKAPDDLNEGLLMEIAKKTDGEYFQAKTSKDLAEAFSSIDKLEKTKEEYTKSVNYNEQYLKFLIPAFWFLLAGFILQITVFKRLP